MACIPPLFNLNHFAHANVKNFPNNLSICLPVLAQPASEDTCEYGGAHLTPQEQEGRNT